MRYNSESRKRIDLILATLIKEPLTVKLETVDYNHTLLSVAIGTIYTENGPGIALALRNEELRKIRDAINEILTPPLELA